LSPSTGREPVKPVTVFKGDTPPDAIGAVFYLANCSQMRGIRKINEKDIPAAEEAAGGTIPGTATGGTGRTAGLICGNAAASI
jgi:hypothetical protein